MYPKKKDQGSSSQEAEQKPKESDFANKFRVSWQKIPVRQQRRVVRVMLAVLVLMVMVQLVVGVRNTYRLATSTEITQDSIKTSYE
jgi:hypothetical protein